jgi:hypothetical protein
LVTISVTDETGNVRDLSNCTVISQIRKTYRSESNVSFSIDISNPDEGEVNLVLDANTSANIKPGRYVYDALLIDENSYKERIVEGIVTVTPGVSK